MVTSYFVSTLALGLPFLLFHWFPMWHLLLTCCRCSFDEATKILVIETYQKKWKSFFIHHVRVKTIGDGNEDGNLNEGFQDEDNISKPADEGLSLVHFEDGSSILVTRYRYFVHKKCVMIWDSGRMTFCRLASVEVGRSCAELRSLAVQPPTARQHKNMLDIYGPNEISVPVQSILVLLLLEVFNPFYIFQVFTICVWISENYFYYCGAIVLMSGFGITTSIIQTRRNQENLRRTTHHSTEVRTQTLLPDSPRPRENLSPGEELAPGDVLLLPAEGCVLPADVLLLTGTAVVNESMLTGESVPVTKTALPSSAQIYDEGQHGVHTLYCGTRLIQTRYYESEPVKALVIRTGYWTSKGRLVRAILHPAPTDFKFDRDSYKFIIILTVIAILGLIYTIVLKAGRSLSPGDIIVKALDIITIVIPPALPAALTVGRLYAVSRLRRARIFCLNTLAVSVCGSVDTMCFDKTGTLTEEGLDMWGVVPVAAGTSGPLLTTPRREPSRLPDLSDLKLAMATCHSLVHIGGELLGDPLDLKMFESTGWQLEEPEIPDNEKFQLLVPTVVKPKYDSNINVDDFHVPLEVGVVQQYQFVSQLQRGSVAVRILGENVFRFYCKGSPEMLRTLCLAETVPDNLESILYQYTQKGYRVLAAASRVLDLETLGQLQRQTREQLETELTFLGLIVMENRLKPGTGDVVRELRDANINVVMITGDNIHTGVSVARECGIVASTERLYHVGVRSAEKGHPPQVYYSTASLELSTTPSAHETSLESGTPTSTRLAITGEVWRVLREHAPALLPRVVIRGAVYARMTSDQKQQLVQEYQALGYIVGMCGDGANDCAALRSAHAGISLSPLESSAAAAFTARDAHARAAPRVLRESRAALTTSFSVFFFMLAYSLTEFASVALLYYYDSNLTDFQFLFIDVALIINFTFFFGHTEAYDGNLYKKTPLNSLLSFIPLTSLIIHLLLVFLFQFASLFILQQFPWYKVHEPISDSDYKCWENYAIYCISMFQYITLAIVFNHGTPFRKSILTNKLLISSLIIMTAVCTYLTVQPAKWVSNFLELQMPMGYDLRYIILLLAFLQFVIALFFERFVVQFLMEERGCIPDCLKRRRVQKTPHLLLRRELDEDFLNSATVEENGEKIADVVS